MTKEDFERGQQAAQVSSLTERFDAMESKVNDLWDFMNRVKGAWVAIVGVFSFAGAAVGAVAAVITMKFKGH